MKCFVVFLILVGFAAHAFAQEEGQSSTSCSRDIEACTDSKICKDVMYDCSDDDGVTFSKTDELAPISWNIGQINWTTDHHSPNGSVVVQVIDPDMNKSPDKIDKFKITVWSNSDPDGISPSVYETRENTGIFESIIYFSAKPSTGQRLHVIEDDIVIAAYKDHTLPPPHTHSDTLKITDSIIIRKAFANPDEVKNSFIRIEDKSFNRQSLQTGETLTQQGTFAAIIIEGIGAVLIVFFIVLYAVKKRIRKTNVRNTKLG